MLPNMAFKNVVILSGLVTANVGEADGQCEHLAPTTASLDNLVMPPESLDDVSVN